MLAEHCKTPRTPVRASNFAVPVNTINLCDLKSNTSEGISTFLSKCGMSPYKDSHYRSVSNSSNYDSDYSCGTNDVANVSHKVLTWEEARSIKNKCMELIKNSNDNMSKLEFKKQFLILSESYITGTALLTRLCDATKNAATKTFTKSGFQQI